MYRFTLENGIKCEFDESGSLLRILRGEREIPFAGLRFDIGCNEKNLKIGRAHV